MSVQLIAWKDLFLKWPVMCQVGRWICTLRWLGGRVVRMSDSRLASRSWHCLIIYFWDRWPSLVG